jgi:hypothetical protein
MKLENLLALEKKAQCLLPPAMQAFSDGGVVCPWLHWQRENITEWEEREGILIMQDWGNEPEPLNEAVTHLNRPKACKREATTWNLFDHPKWNAAIWAENPSWLVMNAVWGIRKSKQERQDADKTGYLGNEVHKKAFRIWGGLLASLAAVRRRPVKVVFAGAWARFDDHVKNDKDLKKFLKNWAEWALTGDTSLAENELRDKITEIEGNAYFSPHPSMWRKTFDASQGPP